MRISKLTYNHQVSVPADVREALGLKAGDTIQWMIDGGTARVRKESKADWLYLSGVEAGLAEEWLSPEDEEAFRDL